MVMIKFILGLVLALPLVGQTTVYLRDGSAPPFRITNAVTNGSYIRVTSSTTGIAVGDKVTVQGVRGCAHANGTRTVATVGSTYLDLLARDGVTTLDCEEAWIAPSTYALASGMSDSYLGKLVAYTLKPPPNILGFDGPSGSFTNSLTPRAVAGNPAWDVINSRANSQLTYPDRLYTWGTNIMAMAWHVGGRSPSSPYLVNLKKWLNNAHLIYLSPGCDEGYSICGRGGVANAIDFMSPDLYTVTQAFNIAQDQLTAAERLAFVQKMLNDRALNNTSETGCTNALTRAAVGVTLTATAGTNYVTISPAGSASVLAAGDRLDWRRGGNPLNSLLDAEIVVSSVDTSTGVVTLTTILPTSGGDPTTPATNYWFYQKDYLNWNPNTCGYVWLQKHYNNNPAFIAMAGGPNLKPYPIEGAVSGHPLGNLQTWRNRVYMEIGASTCGVSVPSGVDLRGCELFENAEAFYWDQTLMEAKNIQSGPTMAASGAYRGRVEGAFSAVSLMLKNALTPSLDSTTGNWFKDNLMFQLYQTVPDAGDHVHPFGEAAGNFFDGYKFSHYYSVIGAVPTSTEAAYARWWLFNKFPNYTSTISGLNAAAGGYVAVPAFLGVDYNATRTNYTTVLPPQRLFWDTDADATWLGYNAPGGLLVMNSRTGWGTTATSMMAAPLGVYQDHVYLRSPVNYQIYKNGWLYGSVGSTALSNCTTATYNTSCLNGQNEMDSVVEVGRASTGTTTSYGAYNSATPQLTGWTAIPAFGFKNVSWAGSAKSGRASGDYTYMAYDLGAVNALPALTNQRHHYLHFKRDNRDYILRYVSSTTTTTQPMRAYLHFPNNGQSGEGRTSAAVSGVIGTNTIGGTSMHTQVLVPTSNSQTDIGIVKTSDSILTVNPDSTSTYPARYQMGGVSCSWTAPSTINWVSLVGNVYVYVRPSDCALVAAASAGSITGGGGVTVVTGSSFPASDYYPIAVWPASSGRWVSSTAAPYVKDALPHTNIQYERRFVVDLGTTTAGELLVLHSPHGNLTDPAPTASLVSSTSGWRTVQIDGALPSVGAFGYGADCKNSWAATTTHTGTGMYVITNLCPGVYTLTKNSVTVSSPVVAAGDQTITFDSTAGIFSLTSTGAVPVEIVDLILPSATQGVPYNYTLSALGGTPPYTWAVTPIGYDCLTSYGLNLASSGLISGTPTSAGSCSLDLTVSDVVALTDTKTLNLNINPSELNDISINTIAGATSVLVKAGLRGLPTTTSCTATVKDGSNSTVATATSSSGLARRVFLVTGLTESTGYSVNVQCDAHSGISAVAFSTIASGASASSSITSTLPVGASGMTVVYGGTFENSATATCVSGVCTAMITSNIGSIIQYKYTWVGLGRTSAVQYMLVR